jgi:hypothetical protein
MEEPVIHPRDAETRSLAHVLFLGGATDTGKTTLATLLAERHGLQTYYFDRHEMAHFGRAEPLRQPALWAQHPDRMGPEQRWLGFTPEQMARDTLASWMERCQLALDDLRALPTSPPIIAEGPGFFPDCLAPLLNDPRQAVWLVPSEPFKRASVARRDKLHTVPLSDRNRAVANLIERDLQLAEHVRQRAASLDLDVIEVDGSRSLDEMAALLEARFAPWLPAAP